MSKDKPKAGDVWLNPDKQKFIVINAWDWEEVKLEAVYQILYLKDNWYYCEYIKRESFNYCYYLGKSKVNINDLFKTENEE